MDLAKLCEDILTMPYLTLDEQLAYFDAHAEEALEGCRDALALLRPTILSLARKRMIEGFPAYRDKGWRKDEQALRQEELEEYADAVNYRLMRMRKAGKP